MTKTNTKTDIKLIKLEDALAKLDQGIRDALDARELIIKEIEYERNKV